MLVQSHGQSVALHYFCTHAYIPLAYAGFHATGVLRAGLRGAEWRNLIKISPKQADLTVFAVDPRGAHAPFTPPWICWCIRSLGLNLDLSSIEHLVKCISSNMKAYRLYTIIDTCKSGAQCAQTCKNQLELHWQKFWTVTWEFQTVKQLWQMAI